MKKVLLAASAIVAIAGSANAADMRAPVYKAVAPVAAYNWTGFYLGVNAGVGVGEHGTVLNVPAGAVNSSVTGAPIGAIGGVQAGYNWQFGNWVLGLEADIQGSGQSETHCVMQCVFDPPPFAATIEQKLSWFGTVRGRVGYTIGSGVMAYYTGGFAYGDAETTISEVNGGLAGSFKFSDTRTGWTLGSGVEAALGGNWTGKIEYLYVDLGSLSGSYAFSGATHFYSQDVRNHVFRGGLNYRLGGAMLAPQPLANWNGFYIGANLGSGIGRHDNSLLIPTVSGEQFVSAPTGFIGGAQVGYNWQAANWLLGLEADFQGSTQKDTVCVLRCAAGVGSFVTEQTLPWFGTVRGRVGYATGPTLLYITGGLAYGKVEADVTEFIGGPLASYNFSETKTGWTVGGGIERPFDFFGLIGGPNWTAKAEYLYVDLGSTTNSYVQAGAAHTFTTDVTNHVFRTGINYRFGGPVIAKY